MSDPHFPSRRSDAEPSGYPPPATTDPGVDPGFDPGREPGIEPSVDPSVNRGGDTSFDRGLGSSDHPQGETLDGPNLGAYGSGGAASGSAGAASGSAGGTSSAGLTPAGNHGSDPGMKEKASQAAGVVQEEASGVMQEAKSSAAGVVETASDEAAKVASEVKSQGSALLHEAAANLRSQGESGKERAASGLRGLSHELTSLAENSQDQGMAAGLARQAGERLSGVAGFLEDRDLDGVLDDVQRFARRRPFAFFAMAVGAGVVVGRLARALKDAPSGSSGNVSGSSGAGRYGAGPSDAYGAASGGAHVGASSDAHVGASGGVTSYGAGSVGSQPDPDPSGMGGRHADYGTPSRVSVREGQEALRREHAPTDAAGPVDTTDPLGSASPVDTADPASGRREGDVR